MFPRRAGCAASVRTVSSGSLDLLVSRSGEPSAICDSGDRRPANSGWFGSMPVLSTATSWRLAADGPVAGLHMLADGVPVEPHARGLSACFAVRAGAAELWLAADAARPCDCGDGAPDDAAPGDAALGEGWHAAEVEAGRPLRWTGRRARLPALAANGGPVLLRVDLDRPALPRWMAPATAVVPLEISRHRRIA